jgi:hypothetical protein
LAIFEKDFSANGVDFIDDGIFVWHDLISLLHPEAGRQVEFILWIKSGSN